MASISQRKVRVAFDWPDRVSGAGAEAKGGMKQYHKKRSIFIIISSSKYLLLLKTDKGQSEHIQKNTFSANS